MSYGYLVGTFDLVSVADLDLIRSARSRCDDLVLGVCSDEQVLEATGRRPIVALPDRLALVARLRGVSRAVAHRPEEAEGREVMVSAELAPWLLDPSARVLAPGRRSRSAVLRAVSPIRVPAVVTR